MRNFYRLLDKDISSLVRLVRDNGFNTTCSCQGGEGHSYKKPTIEFEYYQHDDIEQLHNLMIENEYNNFTISVRWECINGCVFRFMTLELEALGGES